MRNQQEANDAQIALSLSAGEQEETVSTDQEVAEQLDKEYECYSTDVFYSTQKGHPTEKKYYKTSHFETTGVKPCHEARGVEQWCERFFKDRIDKRCLLESLVNIVKVVITKDFCHAADLLTRKEGQAALEKLNKFGNILLCEHLEISLMKKPKEQQQSTSSTFVVAPTDEVAHS